MRTNLIYDQISERTAEALKQQMAHLSDMAAHSNNRERFKSMEHGAQIMLDILRSDPICDQGTRNWMSGLTRDQLQRAIEIAQDLIKEKTNQGKVTLFGVFKNNDAEWHLSRDEAEACFLAAASDIVKKSNPELSLERRKVPTEELAEYIGEARAAALLSDRQDLIEPSLGKKP